MRYRRGITLMETIIAMFVLGLLTMATLNVFLPALSGLQTADTEYDAQRNALITTTKLAADLRESRVGWVTVNSSYVAIPTSRDARGVFVANPDGTPTWTGWIVYWLVPDANQPDTRQLLREVFLGSFTPPTQDNPYLPPAPPDQGHVVATGLSAFTVVLNPRSGGGGWINVHVETLRVYQSRKTTFEGDKSVELFY